MQEDLLKKRSGLMPKVKGVEMKVLETEGFAIRIAHPDDNLVAPENTKLGTVRDSYLEG